MLKIFRRVDVLRKYFNTIFFLHSVARAGEETYGESNCHGRDFRVFEATTYIKKYGRQQLECRWCAKARKRF